jgi:hypothetical protein
MAGNFSGTLYLGAGEGFFKNTFPKILKIFFSGGGPEMKEALGCL